MKAHCSDLLVHVPPPLPPPPSLCLSFIPLHPSPLHPSSTLLFHPISPLHPIPFLHPLPRAALPDPPQPSFLQALSSQQQAQWRSRQIHSGHAETSPGQLWLDGLANPGRAFLGVACSPRLFLLLLLSCCSSSQGSDWRWVWGSSCLPLFFSSIYHLRV